MCAFANVGKLSDGKPEGTTKDINGEQIPDGEIAMLIPTLEGLHLARQNDWIIRGAKGELYPCKNDIFEATHEPVNDDLML